MACGNPGLWEDFHSRGNANYNFFIETAVHLKQAVGWSDEWDLRRSGGATKASAALLHSGFATNLNAE
jgi:hypothetical protein